MLKHTASDPFRVSCASRSYPTGRVRLKRGRLRSDWSVAKAVAVANLRVQVSLVISAEHNR